MTLVANDNDCWNFDILLDASRQMLSSLIVDVEYFSHLCSGTRLENVDSFNHVLGFFIVYKVVFLFNSFLKVIRKNLHT